MRQRSMALITFNWPRLTCPAFAARHAAPWSRNISATSRDDRDKASYEDPVLRHLRLGLFKASSGLSTAAIMPVATRVYPAVVVSLAWPSSA